MNHKIPGFGFVRVGCVRAGEGRGWDPFAFFISFLLFSFEACTFESVVQCLSMVGGESRDCGEGLVVVLEFLSSRGVLVRYQERLRGWCRVRAVRR